MQGECASPTSRRLVYGILSVALTATAIGCAVAAVVSDVVVWWAGAACALPLAVLVVYLALASAVRFGWDEHGLTRYAWPRERRMAWSDIDRYTVRVGGFGQPDFMLFDGAGQKMSVDFDVLAPTGTPLLELLWTRLAPVRQRLERDLQGAGVEVRGSGLVTGLWVFLALLAGAGAAVFAPSASSDGQVQWLAVFFLALCGSAAVCAALLARQNHTRRLLLDSVGLRWSTESPEQALPWAMIERLTLRREQQGAGEQFSVQGAGRKFHLVCHQPEYLFAVEQLLRRAVNAEFDDRSRVAPSAGWRWLLELLLAGDPASSEPTEFRRRPAPVVEPPERRRKPWFRLVLFHAGVISAYCGFSLLDESEYLRHSSARRELLAGPVVTAEVVGISRSGSKNTILYVYPAGDRPRTVQAEVTAAQAELIQVGATFDVQYLPREPSVHTLPGTKIPRPVPTARDRVLLGMIVGGLLALLPGWTGVQAYRRQFRLRPKHGPGSG